jgi:hypothetical protein
LLNSRAQINVKSRATGAFVEISQPYADSAAAGREEEPVSEIEHIHYDDDPEGNAHSNSDDSD